MDARQLKPKRKQLSVQELDALIAEFFAEDIMNFSSHEDLLAAVQVQPAYLRQLYKLPTKWMEQTYRTHAVYCTTSCVQLPSGHPDMLSYLRAKFEASSATMDQRFDYVILPEAVRRAALCWYKCDLFLLIFLRGVYFDPVKIAMWLPGQSGGKQVRHTLFLLWSDITLQCITHTDVMAVFLVDTRTPTDICLDIQDLKDTPLLAVETSSIQVVPAHL